MEIQMVLDLDHCKEGRHYWEVVETRHFLQIAVVPALAWKNLKVLVKRCTVESLSLVAAHPGKVVRQPVNLPPPAGLGMAKAPGSPPAAPRMNWRR